MKQNLFLVLVVAIFTAFSFTGCENGNSDDSSSGPDDLDISSAQTLGTRKDIVAQNAAITRELYSANVSDGSVVLSFEPLNWPTEGSSKKIDGTVHLYWEENGQVIGGSFDAHGVNQTVKGLENVYGGYLSGKRPPAGATVYFCMVSLNNAERTNVKQSATPW